MVWFQKGSHGRYGLPLILMLAGAARLYGVDSKSLWLDEAVSVFIANQPLGRMMKIIVEHDTPPPLYYTLLHFWVILGDSPLIVRLLSVCFGLAAVVGAYLLGKEMFGQSTGLAAGLLMAISPFHVWYSQEARMYALLSMSCTFSAYFLIRALKTERKGCWVAYIVATSIAIYTQVSSAFFLIAEWVAVSLYIQPKLLHRPWLVSQVALLLIWLPWLPNFLVQSHTYQRFWIDFPTPDQLITLLFEFTSAYLPHWKVPNGREMLVIASLCLVLFAIKGSRWKDYLLLLSLFTVPIVTMYLFSMYKPIFLSRALIFCVAPLLVLVAQGLLALTRWRIGTPAIVALALINVISLYQLYAVQTKEEWDQATEYVIGHAKQGELVLFIAADTQIPFDYYSRNSDLELEKRGLPTDVFTEGSLEPAMGAGDLGRMDRLIEGNDSFWLVVSHSEFPDPEQIAQSHADNRYHLVDRMHFQGIVVSRYETDRRQTSRG